MFTTPGGSSAWRRTSQKRSAVRGVVSAGLRTTVFPAASDLPREHEEREVPWDDLARHADRARAAVRERVLELVRPAGVVEEMRGRERHVDVARLLDRLASVERLEHGELAAPLLQDPRDAEEVLRALGRPEAAPPVLVRVAGGRDREVDVLRAAVGHLGERLLGCRADGGLVLAGLRLEPLAADEEPVPALEADDVARLRRRRVVER
jgi:hypothetical protein